MTPPPARAAAPPTPLSRPGLLRPGGQDRGRRRRRQLLRHHSRRARIRRDTVGSRRQLLRLHVRRFRHPHHVTAVAAAGTNPRADEQLPVVVIGAGPVGLAAAAHLHERGLAFTVVEAGNSAGAAVAEWGHVRVFSPWRYNIDHAAGRLLDAAGWSRPDLDLLPTGAELVEQYLQPLAKLPQLAPHVRYTTRVVAIGRVGVDRVKTAGRDQAPFVVRLATGQDILASAVIDASGTWTRPNVLGANGLPAHGEQDAAALIGSALPDVLGADRDTYAGKHTVIVGAGHSAANTLLALAELAEQEPGTRITWATRGGSIDRAVGGGDADTLPGRGALGTGIKLLVNSGRVELVTGFAVQRVDVVDGQRS